MPTNVHKWIISNERVTCLIDCIAKMCLLIYVAFSKSRVATIAVKFHRFNFIHELFNEVGPKETKGLYYDEREQRLLGCDETSASFSFLLSFCGIVIFLCPHIYILKLLASFFACY